MRTRPVNVILRHLRQLSAPNLDEANDGELLRHYAASRDEEAFTLVVRRHGPMVLAICRRLLDDGPDSEDAFQATFLVLARKADSLPWRESVAGWLHRVARHVALRARTAAARRRLHEGRAVVAPPIDPLAEVSLREAQEILDQELARLPDQYRAPLLLCCLHGSTRDEAARNLGWSLATLKRRLKRGRDLLRERLAKRGLTLPAALTAVSIPALAPPSLPAALALTTVETARSIALGQAGDAAARVSELAESALSTLSPVKWKAVLAVVVVLGMIAGGAGIAACLAPVDHATVVVENGSAQRAATSPGKPATEPARTDFYGDPLPSGALARLGTSRMRDVSGFVAFSPDGKIVLTYTSNILRLHETATRKLVKQWALRGRVPRNGLSRDGKTLALHAADGLSFWDVATGKRQRLVKVSLGHSWAAALSPDWQTLLVVGEDKVVRLLDTTSGKLLRRLEDLIHAESSVVFSPDGKRIASGSRDRTARVWDVATGKRLYLFAGHEHDVYDVDFSPDGKRLVTAGVSRQGIHVFDLTIGKEVAPPLERNGAEKARFSTRGDLLAVGGYGGLELFDARTGKKVRTFGDYMGRGAPLAFSPDGKTLAAFGGDGTLSLGDVATGKELCPLMGHHGTVGAVAFSHDGKLVVSADWNTVYVWESATGKNLRAFPEGNQNWLTSLAFSPDGKLLAYGSCNGPRRLWDVAGWKEYRPGDDRDSTACCVAFSPDGRKLATVQGYRPAVKIWDVATGKRIAQCAGHVDRAYAVVFSSDGELVISVGEDHMVRIWKTATGDEIRHIAAHQHPIECLALSPDGRTLATGTWKGPVCLWEVVTGKQRLQLAGHSHGVRCLAFSPDGQTLASGSFDAPGSLLLSHVATGKELGVLEGHRGNVTAVAFSHDGKRLASGGNDSTALVWDVTHWTRRKASRATPLNNEQLEDLWRQLAGEDAAKAYQAIGRLVGSPNNAVPFLTRRLVPVRAPDAGRIRRLLAELDSDQFRVRERAEAELLKLGDKAEPALRQILREKQSLEAHRRVERILNRLESTVTSGDVLRGIRCVEVLEQMGTQAARQILKRLADGAESRLTREAKAALRR